MKKSPTDLTINQIPIPMIRSRTFAEHHQNFSENDCSNTYQHQQNYFHARHPNIPNNNNVESSSHAQNSMQYNNNAANYNYFNPNSQVNSNIMKNNNNVRNRKLNGGVIQSDL